MAKPGTVVKLGKADPATALQLIPTPTPRWPDLLTIYSPKQKMLLSSKLFSAHVSPDLAAQTSDKLTPAEATVEACDRGGWDLYGRDWRYFYECTLAPVAQQVASALERLDVQVVPAGVARTLGLESGWLVESVKGLFSGIIWGICMAITLVTRVHVEYAQALRHQHLLPGVVEKWH